MRVNKTFVLSAVMSFYALLAAVHLGSARAQNLDKSAWPTKEWLPSTPEEQGMDSAALARFVTYGGSHRFDSLLVVRHGRIVTEAYYAPYAADIPHQIQSSTKAVIGTLVGMLYKNGVIDRLDHPVLDYFADRHIANVDDRKKAITVQNLLDMTSGFDWEQGIEDGREQTLHDMDRSSDWTQFILDRPMAHSPGEVFNYIDGSPNLLSAIITKLTGKLAEDYARGTLFGPLGITDWHWDRERQGLTVGAWTLTMRPRDMAKIGYLYLHHGEWDGQQLLPPGWGDVLSHATVTMHASFDPDLSYSNFFWVFPERHVFMAVGWHGQLIAVFPDLDVVAVVTAHSFVRFGDVIDGVSAATKSESALPPNPNAAEPLAKATKDAAVEKPTVVGPTPEIASAISEKTYKFPDAEPGLKSLTLFLTGAHPHFEYTISSVTYATPIGLDGSYRKGSPALFGHNPGHIPASKGTWLNGQTFKIDTQDLGYGGEKSLLLSFSGRNLNVRITSEQGQEWSVDGEQVE
jgi:CubicO group peptidase (beta-lactamase class C family)